MDFKPLLSSNAGEAYFICQHSHPIPWSFNVFADCLSAPYAGFELSIDSTVIGYYIALQVLDEITLMDIAVAEDYRGKGYGQQLLAHFIGYAESVKAVSCWLEVRQGNRAAIALYEANGFSVIETRKGYYQVAYKGSLSSEREDAFVMQRLLINL